MNLGESSVLESRVAPSCTLSRAAQTQWWRLELPIQTLPQVRQEMVGRAG